MKKNAEVDASENMESFIGKLAALGKRANAGVSMVSFKKAKKFSGGDVYILFAAKGCDRFEVVDTLIRSIAEDD
jgi:hypothetical protein